MFLYDVRTVVVIEPPGHGRSPELMFKINISNPAPFGFHTPDEVIYDMHQQLTDCEGYSMQ